MAQSSGLFPKLIPIPQVTSRTRQIPLCAVTCRTGLASFLEPPSRKSEPSGSLSNVPLLGLEPQVPGCGQIAHSSDAPVQTKGLAAR